jgi:branched-chain amino acid transport system substrate-binding protein
VSVDAVDVGFIGLINTVKSAGPVFQEAETPLLMLWDAKIPGAGLEGLTYVFGTGFSSPAAGQLLAQHARKQGLTTFAVLHQPDEWSELISRSFAQEIVRQGGYVQFDEQVSLDDADFKTVLLKIKEADAIYAPFVSNQDVFIRRARELGYTGQILSGDGVTDQVIQNAGRAAKGMLFTQVHDPGNPAMQHLHAVYEQKYHQKMDVPVFVALGYDGVHLVKDAIERAGSTDSNAIRDALAATQGFQGVLGETTMDSIGGSPKAERVFVVKDGQMVLAE